MQRAPHNLAGFTASSDFPTLNPLQPGFAGGPEFGDVFVAALEIAGAAQFEVSVSPGSVTVSPGHSAGYSVTVNPTGAAFDEAVSLNCSGLPALAACAFAPSEVTPGTSPASSSLTVSTTASSSSSATSTFRFGGPSREDRISLALLVLGLTLGAVGLVRRGSHRSVRTSRSLLWTGVVTVMLAVYSGCGGEDSTGPTRSGTPSGTYTITIAGASTSLQQSTTVTLIVR